MNPHPLLHHPGLLSACAVALLLFTGCASIDSAPPRFAVAETALKDADAYYDDVLKRYVSGTDDAGKKAVRDEFIETRMALIDLAYAGFRQTMYAQRVGANVGVDLATLGLAAAGAATSSEQAKTGLHALSGALIGGKASIDKNVFFDRTLPALLAQMEASRSAVRLRLLTGMMVGTDRYPLLQARSDVEEYYTAGTIIGAISGITDEAAVVRRKGVEALAERLPSAEEVKTELTAMGFDVQRAANDDTSRQLLQCWRVTDATARKTNQAAIRKWVADRGLPFTTPPSAIFRFFNAEDQATNRQAALSDAALRAGLKACPLSAPVSTP